MYKLVYFVPESHLEVSKDAVFSAGAGAMGKYRHCCWQTLGQGQFLPEVGSKPYIGRRDELSVVPEYRVETVCCEQDLAKVIASLKEAHPYEEPAIDIIRLESV